MKKLKENIRSTGLYPAIIVRAKDDFYQILDGHHRAIVLQELGYEEADCEIWNVDDKQALILLATLNRLRGTDDIQSRANLMKELSFIDEEFSFVDLVPESNDSLNALISTLDSDTLTLKQERGIVEEKLLQAGVDMDMSERIARSYTPPTGVPILKFVFKNIKDYNVVVDYFGSSPEPKKLLNLIYAKQNKSRT